MNTISVIVPIFHGKQYINGLIEQVTTAGRLLEKENSIELILSNDAPDDLLPEIYGSDRIDILVLNTECNRGIQGARVHGLENSHGDYILFLDQDDKIEPEYFKSQLESIGEHDAVVCQVIHENKPFYNSDYPFEWAFNKEFMLQQGCPIISPGQVLIRREAVSEVWKNNIIQSNGADDFLLWLCMVGEGKTFARNDKVVFSHIVKYNNTSWNSAQMLASEEEMRLILKRNHVFQKEDEILLDNMIQHIYNKRLKNLDKFRRMFYILSDWMSLKEKGICISTYLISQGIHNVAIYGVGYLGKHLIQELKDTEVKISYLIDKNAPWIETEYKAYTLDDELEKVDGVIVTLVQDEKVVVEALYEKLDAKIITIMNLIGQVEGASSPW